MGGMDLHPVEARPFSQPGGGDEAALHLGDVIGRHGARGREMFRLRPEVQCHRRGGQCILAKAGGHLAAGMIDLHPELGPPGAAGRRPGPETVDLAVILQHHAARPGHPPSHCR